MRTRDDDRTPDEIRDRDRVRDHGNDRPRPAVVHRETAREAGLGRVSTLSIVAGTMCAYGTFAIVAAIAGSLLSNTDLETDFRTDDWTSSGAAAGLVTALVLFAAYLFGGYVAGRMARRSGVFHGVGVFVLSLIVGLLVGSVASTADGLDVADNLRSIGVPTDLDQIESVGVAAAIASLVGMLAGSIVGGTLGERWHTKLARRFEDPAYGPAAEARARAEREDRAHGGRRDADTLVGHESDRTIDRSPERDEDRDLDRDGDIDRHDRERVEARDRMEARNRMDRSRMADADRDAGDADAVDRRGLHIDDPRRETIDLRRPRPSEDPVADDELARRDVPSGRRPR